ncbi:TPA: hypothetical protein EYP38_01280, partial [Candidatus Micrarchaeota archaeon]|nr:hypothetical protein [Candidatus Micrarchaeota archaeon]
MVTGYRRSIFSWTLLVLALGTLTFYVMSLLLPKGPFYTEWKKLDTPISPALSLYLMLIAAFFFTLATLALLEGRPHWLASFFFPLLFMATLGGIGLYSNIVLRLSNQ